MLGQSTLRERLKEPLTETTRKTRRNLLAAAVTGIVIVQVGLVPKKISAFGIEFSEANQESLLQLVSAVILFYAITFLVYVLSELTAWKIALKSEEFEFMLNQKENIRDYIGESRRDMFFDQINRLSFIANPVFLLRLAVEVILPITLAVWAFSLTWSWGT
ncbi:hypothetical protein NB476_14275 [Vibrio sp. RM-44-3]|uniref:hypothetical protein n=1 Tax=unclassified Vibrio TaxID=2614977 RepID=UPI00215BF12F|nr:MULTISPECIES: hypothetical protein [unclassified Vibrio]MCR9552121.1 hypothetical protein [Vibrio sp. RM-41-2A]MCR9557602.1 hypothetical protein [Vibrio sp. RM-41-2B]MCR9623510.1 hypothetical protein [Vibrio sp. RM-44-3]